MDRRLSGMPPGNAKPQLGILLFNSLAELGLGAPGGAYRQRTEMSGASSNT
jgi:hypothetical protein